MIYTIPNSKEPKSPQMTTASAVPDGVGSIFNYRVGSDGLKQSSMELFCCYVCNTQTMIRGTRFTINTPHLSGVVAAEEPVRIAGCSRRFFNEIVQIVMS